MRIITLLLAIMYIVAPQFGGAQIIPPYTNNFDSPTDTAGWSHYALSGTDDWEMGAPTNASYQLDYPYSTPWVWATDLDANMAASSNRCLETPAFDFSDTTKVYNLSFYHTYKTSGSTSKGLYVEYSIDGGLNWTDVPKSGVRKINWYNQRWSGWIYSYSGARIELPSLAGESQVSFRFRADASSGGGWLIDNFKVAIEDNEIYAQNGPLVANLNKNFSSFDIAPLVGVSSWYWNELKPMVTSFYLSNDTLLDAGDTFLHTDTTTIGQWGMTYNHTIPMPSNISTGMNYIIFKLNSGNTILEANHSNNIGYCPVFISPIYEAPYLNNFDSTAQTFNTTQYSGGSTWSRIWPNEFQAGKPRSGTRAWCAYPGPNGANNYLTTPFLSLENSTNSVFCFWSRSPANLFGTGNTSSFHFVYPSIDTTYTTYPNFNTLYYDALPENREYSWDCHCVDIASFDGVKSTIFKLAPTAYNPTSLPDRFAVIDDLYIGPRKPDAALEGEKEIRYTSNALVSDTLFYAFYNSGLTPLPSTVTKFYWSTDSILDAADTYLGSNTEPVVPDTSSVRRSFQYTKPTTQVGDYYILYELDVHDSVNEMREFDNEGYIKITQTTSASLPYLADFETSDSGWYHRASFGADYWTWTTPTDSLFTTTNGSSKAFATVIPSGNPRSRSHLFSPIFDLTTLQNPVLEFDLISTFIPGQAHLGKSANLMYSTDGGYRWHVLLAKNKSVKRGYYNIDYHRYSGADSIGNTPQYYSFHLYGSVLPSFLYYQNYQGRDFTNNHHNVFDISFLNGYKNVQFMVVTSVASNYTNGLSIDNFEINEAKSDLKSAWQKNLLVAGDDAHFKPHFKIVNDENYITDSTFVNIYLSTDSVLDASDYFVDQQAIPELRPFMEHLISVDKQTPSNFGTYQYVLLDIDPNNLVSESNELNNLGVHALGMDSTKNLGLPILFDFNDDEVHGWPWYQDSAWGDLMGQRFRHKKIIGDRNHLFSSGELALDPMAPTISGFSIPTFFLESPTFNFTNWAGLQLNFDLLCVGTPHWIFNHQLGGLMEYSLDGGDTWTILGQMEPGWYNRAHVPLLGGPGWTNCQSWTNFTRDIGFLSGESSVKFRFKYRSNIEQGNPGLQGLRLDNFKIEGDTLVTLPPIHMCQGDSVQVFGQYIYHAGNFYDTAFIPANNQTNIPAHSLFTLQEVFVTDSTPYIDSVSICMGSPFTTISGYTYPQVNQSFWDSASIVTGAGCDSNVYTYISVTPTYSLTDTIEICQGSTHVFADGTIYSNIQNAFSHTDSLISLQGCDSIVSTHVVMHPVYAFTDTVWLCSGDTFSFPNGDHLLLQSDTLHQSVLTTMANCDSIRYTQILTHPAYTFWDTVFVCPYDDYTFIDGTVVSNIGSPVTHTSTFSTQNGCDSNYITTVELHSEYIINDTAVVCVGDSFTFPDGTHIAQVSGNQVHLNYLNSQYGCDSLVIFHLETLTGQISYDTLVACMGSIVQLPDGSSHTVAGTYTHTTQWTNSVGCDSLLYTYISPLPTSQFYDTMVVCQGSNVSFADGTTLYQLTSDTNYSSTLVNAMGCDSTIYIQVFVIPVNIQVTVHADTLHASLAAAQYQWLMCTGNGFTAIPNATSQWHIATSNGEYAVEITTNGCTDTSACYLVNATHVGINSSDESVTIYPNPTAETVFIDITGPNSEVVVVVKSVTGQILHHQTYTNLSHIGIPLNGASGLHIIEVHRPHVPPVVKQIIKL